MSPPEQDRSEAVAQQPDKVDPIVERQAKMLLKSVIWFLPDFKNFTRSQ